MKYNLQKHADACNEFTADHIQEICDKLKIVQKDSQISDLIKMTNDLECVDLVMKIAEKNRIDVAQLIGYMKTLTALKSIEVTIQ